MGFWVAGLSIRSKSDLLSQRKFDLLTKTEAVNCVDFRVKPSSFQHSVSGLRRKFRKVVSPLFAINKIYPQVFTLLLLLFQSISILGQIQ